MILIHRCHVVTTTIDDVKAWILVYQWLGKRTLLIQRAVNIIHAFAFQSVSGVKLETVVSHLKIAKVRCRERKKGAMLLEQKFDKFLKFGKVLSLEISYFQIEKKIVAKLKFPPNQCKNSPLTVISSHTLYIAQNSVTYTQAVIGK